jgi:hypothetical protein
MAMPETTLRFVNFRGRAVSQLVCLFRVVFHGPSYTQRTSA